MQVTPPPRPAGTPPRGPGEGRPESLQERSLAILAQVTHALPGGEVRPQQLEMGRAVARAMEDRRHLVVQAGTGTGKSLAYLVPAALSGRPVVVATATKALQDQLGDKDLPQVATALGRSFQFAVLKGRSNYLCRQRAVEIGEGAMVAGAVPARTDVQPDLAGAEAGADRAEATEGGAAGGAGDGAAGGAGDGAAGGAGDGAAGGAGDGAADEAAGGAGDGAADEAAGGAGDDDNGGGLADQVRRLVQWAGKSRSGDRADLPFEPNPRAWAMVSVGPRECPGAFRCPSGNECFAEAARDRAAAADVVVVNTHLYGAHLASGGTVLPPHDLVVFDEAHEVEEVMTASLGAEVSPGRLRALVTLARPVLRAGPGGPLDELAVLADRLQGELGDRIGTRVLQDPPTRSATVATPGSRAGDRATGPPQAGAAVGGRAGRQRVREVPGGREWLPPAGAPGGGEPGSVVRDEQLQGLLGLAATGVNDVLGELRRGQQTSLLPEAPDDGGRRGRALSAAGHLAEDLARLLGRGDDLVAWVDGTTRAPVLRLSPVDVGPVLAESLWPEVTAVLTSATVPVRMAERLGLDGAPFDELDVGSPFDYRSHSLLYVARHLPDRRRPESEAAVHEELVTLIQAAGGRTLALFTSRRATEAAAAVVRERLSYRVLAQGELPKGRLLEEFASDETSCLFATMSFWQGVDVPGRALSLVTLDRLPFARPDEPLTQARRERAGDAAFRLVDLPRAATLLAQGVGRLVRSADDHGVVAVLDPRLATAGYRGVLLARLPPMRRTTERRQVEEFLARVLADPGADADPAPDRSLSSPAGRAGPGAAASASRR